MPLTQSRKTCAGCIWHDQCADMYDQMICDDYDPVDEDEENTYEDLLVLRRGAYQEMIDEYSDDTPLSDQLVM